MLPSPVLVSLDLFGQIEPSQRPGDLVDFMARLAPIIDVTIKRLAKAKFRKDPISGDRYSRISSILGSAQKRHGHIIEAAIREGLRDRNQYRVWTEPEFAVSRAADNLVHSQSIEACCCTELPYGDRFRSIQIDVGVYDDAERRIGTYEIKRGNGLHDSNKIRSVIRDLLCTHMLLKSYGRMLGFAPDVSASKIIFYYGQRSIPAPLSLIGAELDDHFGFPIIARVEKANAYFREQLHILLGELR